MGKGVTMQCSVQSRNSEQWHHYFLLRQVASPLQVSDTSPIKGFQQCLPKTANGAWEIVVRVSWPTERLWNWSCSVSARKEFVAFRVAHSCSTWARGAVSLVGAESFATVKQRSSFIAGGSSRRPCGKTTPPWCCQAGRLFIVISPCTSCGVWDRTTYVRSHVTRSHGSLVQAGHGSKG